MKYLNYLLAITLLLFTYNAGAQTTFISENFSGGSGATPPTGWTNNTITGQSYDNWRFNNPGSRTTASPIAGQFAIFDSDDYSSGGGSENVALESPSFNTTGSSVVILEFDQQFRHGFGGSAYVEVWNGSSWTSVYSITGGSGYTTNSQSIDISSVAANKAGVQVRFRWTGNYSWWWIVDNVVVYAPPACSGTPTPGNTLAAQNPICNTGGSTVLSLQNTTTGTGVSYQWQSSTNGTTYSNISGATSSTYTASPTSSTYYRCNVTCSNSSSTGTSTPILINSSFLGCYCIPTHGASCGGFGDDIRNVTFGSINNTTTCNNYTDYGGSITAPQVTIGGSQSISVTVGPGGTERVVAWIDFNQNGTFDASEYTFIGTGNNSTVTNSISIPASAKAGVTKMRVRVRWSTTPSSTDACTFWTYGESEDYNVELVCPTVTTTTQPNNATICPGGNTSFTSAASTSGGIGITYQWQVNTGTGWSNITNGGFYSNATTGTLNVSSATSGLNGYQYRCVATSNCGSVATSNAATLTILAQPAVTANPTNDTICVNANTTYSVSATGFGLTYQWQENTGSGWTNITNGGIYSNATTSTLSLTGVTSGMHNNQYRCVVSGTCSPSATSNSALLVITNALSITSHPSAATVCTGTPGTMSVSATAGGLNITYQWQVNSGSGWSNATNGATYTGVTTNTITFANPTLAMNGNMYRCVVTNECGTSQTSNSATLTVNTSPTVSVQPGNQTICPGGTAVFSTTASGSSAISYQWQYNFGAGWTNLSNYGPFSGAYTNTLSVSNPSKYYNGYQFRCQLNTGCTPAATTNAATMTINTQPNIILDPQNKSACPAGSTSFFVNASGTGVAYQWQVSTNGGSSWSNLSNSGIYSNVTSATLGLSNILSTMNNYRYRCIVSGTCTPSVTSASATLSVGTTTSITSQPSSQTVCGNTTTTFTTNANGTNVTYQWQWLVSGTWQNIPGAATGFSGVNNSTLTVSGINPGSSYVRNLRCQVGGDCGTVNSSTATLTIYGKPYITVHPSSTHTMCEGGGLTIPVSAVGHNISYQWEVNTGSGWSTVSNGTNYSGATTSSLKLLTVPASFNGNQYRCVVSGTCTPNVTSTVLTLTVNALVTPTIAISPSMNDICAGTNVTFTSSITGGGSNPSYQWQVNGNNVGGNSSTYSSSSLSNTDNVKCILTSNYVCPSANNVSSNSVVMQVTSYSTPSIAISSNTGNVICSGISTTFKSSITNGGTMPAYDWQVNNVSVGVLTDSFVTSTLQDGDEVKCVLASSLKCPSPASIASNVIKMTVNQTTKSSIVVAPNPDSNICDGQKITMYSFFNNAGTFPQFQWVLNGNDIPGATLPTYVTTNLQDGDVIQCRLTSNLTCVFPELSAPVTFDVTQNVTPAVGIIVYPNGPGAFNFVASPTNGGTNPAYTWYINGVRQTEQSNTFTATDIKATDRVHVDMVSSLECVTQKTVTSRQITTGVDELNSEIFSDLRLFPNPNTGQFTITGMMSESLTNEDVLVRITNSVGQVIYNKSYRVSGNELSLPVVLEESITNGLYMVNIMVNGEMTSMRFMINR